MFFLKLFSGENKKHPFWILAQFQHIMKSYRFVFIVEVLDPRPPVFRRLLFNVYLFRWV